MTNTELEQLSDRDPTLHAARFMTVAWPKVWVDDLALARQNLFINTVVFSVLGGPW